MKWFRHFSNARDSDKIKQIIDEFGLEGYARWFLFLELACDRFDGNLSTIRLHNDEFCGQIKCKHASFVNKTLCFWDKLGLTSHKLDGKFIIIDVPILLELQDKDSKYNRKRIATHAKSTTPRREENIEKNIRENFVVADSAIVGHLLEIGSDAKKFKPDLESLYAEFPKKEGKKKGIERFSKIIKTQETYVNVLTAIRNYSNQCRETEKQYIKQFSSFSSVWEDYIVVDESLSENEEIIANLDARPFNNFLDEARENGQL